MRIFISFLTLLFFSNFCFSQDDSLRIEQGFADAHPILMTVQDYQGDCAHGHICCQTSCSCCPDNNSITKRDVLSSKRIDKVTRTIIVERLIYGSGRNYSSLEYHFKKGIAGRLRKYYSVRYNYVRGMIIHSGRSLVFANEFKEGNVLVRDEDYSFCLIDSLGNVSPLEIVSEEPITKTLKKVYAKAGLLDVFEIQLISDSLPPMRYRYSKLDETKSGDFVIARRNGGGISVVNSTGIETISGMYREVKELPNNHFALNERNGWEIFEGEGAEIGKMGYDRVEVFSDNVVLISKKYKYASLDFFGELNFKLNYDYLDYRYGDFLFYEVNDLYGFIDTNGREVVPPTYSYFTPFNEGRAAVQVGKLWGVIDTAGTFIVEPKYSQLHHFHGGYARAFINGEGSGIIDKDGKTIIDCKYDIGGYGRNMPWFVNDVIMAMTYGSKNREILFFNTKGEEIARTKKYLYGKMTVATNTFNLMPCVIVQGKNRKQGLISLSAEELISPVWDAIYVLDEQRALVYKEQEVYIYNYNAGTRKRLVDGRLKTVPSKGSFDMFDVDGKVVLYDYEGNELEPKKEERSIWREGNFIQH